MPHFIITIGHGMIAVGGRITIRTLCLCWAGGGTGTPAIGIPPGAMTHTAWYPYDGPIYTGYANLTPDRIIDERASRFAAAMAITRGQIDGDIGPQTREALAAFQSDNGLAVTSAVDSTNLADARLVVIPNRLRDWQSRTAMRCAALVFLGR